MHRVIRLEGTSRGERCPQLILRSWEYGTSHGNRDSTNVNKGVDFEMGNDPSGLRWAQSNYRNP